MSSVLSSDSSFYQRALISIAVSTFILTASFVGILSMFSGFPEGIGDRTPFYLVAMGFTFVITILYLENQGTESRVIMVTAAVLGIGTFISVSLTVEGIIFAIRFPEKVFVSQLVYYFIAAALIGTGVGYWSIQHWREFTRTNDGL